MSLPLAVRCQFSVTDKLLISWWSLQFVVVGAEVLREWLDDGEWSWGKPPTLDNLSEKSVRISASQSRPITVELRAGPLRKMISAPLQHFSIFSPKICVLAFKPCNNCISYNFLVYFHLEVDFHSLFVIWYDEQAAQHLRTCYSWLSGIQEGDLNEQELQTQEEPDLLCSDSYRSVLITWQSEKRQGQLSWCVLSWDFCCLSSWRQLQEYLARASSFLT